MVRASEGKQTARNGERFALTAHHFVPGNCGFLEYVLAGGAFKSCVSRNMGQVRRVFCGRSFRGTVYPGKDFPWYGTGLEKPEQEIKWHECV